MKRIFFILIAFIGLQSLFATQFKDMYHKNYGIIDRLVLVFDKKPVYSIDENENDIQINLENCIREKKVENINCTDNQVLDNIKVVFWDDKLMVVVSAQTNYHLDYFDFQSDQYKIVLDIFARKNPETKEEYLEFGNFYTAVGQKSKGKEYLAAAKSITSQKTVLEKVEQKKSEAKKKPIEKSRKTEVKPSKEKKEGSPADSELKEKETIPVSEKRETVVKDVSLSKVKDKKWLIILGIFVVLTIVVLLIILFKKKKPKEFEFDESEMRSTGGFGSKDFQKRMINKLLARGWECDEIAAELNLTTREVEACKLLYDKQS